MFLLIAYSDLHGSCCSGGSCLRLSLSNAANKCLFNYNCSQMRGFRVSIHRAKEVLRARCQISIIIQRVTKFFISAKKTPSALQIIKRYYVDEKIFHAHMLIENWLADNFFFQYLRKVKYQRKRGLLKYEANMYFFFILQTTFAPEKFRSRLKNYRASG